MSGADKASILARVASSPFRPEFEATQTESTSGSLLSYEKPHSNTIVGNSGQNRVFPRLFLKTEGSWLFQEHLRNAVHVVPKAGFEPARDLTPNGF